MAFPNTAFFHLCDATPQKVVYRILCLKSHFEDEGKDYYLLSQFYQKLLQTFLALLLQYFWKTFNFFTFYLWHTVLMGNLVYRYNKINIIIQGITWKKNFDYLYYCCCLINFLAFPLLGRGEGCKLWILMVFTYSFQCDKCFLKWKRLRSDANYF